MDMDISFDEAVLVLEKHDQGHLLRFWNKLSGDEQTRLLAQISNIDFGSIARMRSVMGQDAECKLDDDIAPADVLTIAERHSGIGDAALKAGEVGVLLVAGGQGSRLGFDGPKGAYPIGPLSDASLFSVHSRKILALGRKCGKPLPFYIMTSRSNDKATRDFFIANDYFGLNKNDVMFFVQGMWPVLDETGSVIQDRPGSVFMSPDGHGGILDALLVSGMFDDMKRRGIESLFYFQVDNPLVEIADPNFIGAHLDHNSEISIKVCAKRDAQEGLGVVVMKGSHNAIVEYTELTTEQKEERLPDGSLRLNFGSVAIHVFSLEFLLQEAKRHLPVHMAHKKVPCCDENGESIIPDKPNAFKFEKFIFDVLPDAERSVNVEFAREDEFSPVKNASGSDSPDTAKRDIIMKFSRWLTQCGVEVPVDEHGESLYKIEIDPCYALGVDDLRRKLPPDFKLTTDLLLA